jgi:hypothetical protein
MFVIYRISDTGYQKDKPDYINNQNCFENALRTFNKATWWVIADNVGDETKSFIDSHIKTVEYVSVGNGAGTFNLALDIALNLDDEEIVYFLENDYLHKPEADVVLQSAFDMHLGIEYVTLYDHPDKYMEPGNGGNPHCYGKAENTRVFLGNYCHWKLTNSTTMTFAAKVRTLKQDEKVLRGWTMGTHPNDFQMFSELRQKGRQIISPIPGYSTHGETKWLSPLNNWKNEL